MKCSCGLGFGMEMIWKSGDNVGLSLQWQEQNICSTLILAVTVPDLTWPDAKWMFLINHLHIYQRIMNLQNANAVHLSPIWCLFRGSGSFLAKLSLHSAGSYSTAPCHGWQTEGETKKCYSSEVNYKYGQERPWVETAPWPRRPCDTQVYGEVRGGAGCV